jgi:hypothetical protein
VPRVRPGAPRDWKKLPVNNELRNDRLDVQNILRDKVFAGGQQEQFENYYRNYFLPRWTLPENLASLPGYRKELRNDLRLGRTGPPHAMLREIAREMLTDLALGADYHPAVRYNAMLMIGELNQEEPARSGDEPVPLAAAQPLLLDAVENPDQIDAVRVAALIGLNRHVQLQRPSGGALDRILRTMLDLVSSPKPAGRSVEGQAWIRSLAIHILGNLGTTGPDNVVPKTLARVMADDENSLLATRCHAVEAMGKLRYQGGAGVDPLPLFREIGKLAHRVCRDEIELTEEHNSVFRRMLVNTRLTEIQRGLEGLKNLAGEAEEQQIVQTIEENLDKWLEVLDNRRLEDYEVPAELDEELEGFLDKLQPESPQAAAGPSQPETRTG